MAYKNKIIQNTKTGQDIHFIQTGRETNGLLLEMETTYHARSLEPALHYHPVQEEDFIVLAGELTVRIDGRVQQLKTGDRLHVPARKAHAMWNNSDNATVVNWKVRPAKDTDVLLETGTGLANDGKVNKKGMPPILQVALLVSRFSGVFRLAKPSWLLQQFIFVPLIPVAWLCGYRSVYKKYID